jgi:redox-sensitive bicupin YhaK (pirin superfamily)
MRTIKALHKAAYEPIADLVTYRALPSGSLQMNALDPFIFLNHHGLQEYLPNNQGLPFGPHPHRGFETVTFILEGDLMHKDSSGGGSVITAGGVQWMTAGRGLIHAEVSSDEFKGKGGRLEILQLWVNLPARFKMTEPKYTGLQKEAIPLAVSDEGKVQLHAVSGNWNGVQGPVTPLYDVALCYIDIKKEGQIDFSIAKEKNILLYVVRGSVKVNGREAAMHHLVEFEHNDEKLRIGGIEDALLLFGHATPFNEGFAAHGPFVMNTREEIMQAYDDYHKGAFGSEDLGV